MAKVDHVQDTAEGPGFMVRQDDNTLVANFVFQTRTEALAAHQKMLEILATCRSVEGFSRFSA
jgi:hypothetical protein